MKVITNEVEIHAPIQRVFDLARSIELHAKSAEAVHEEIVDGVNRGLAGLGDETTWYGRYLGFMQTITFQVSAWTPPGYFQTSMVRGPFSRVNHHYLFCASGEVTTMSNVLSYAVPYGVVGTIVDVILLRGHLKRFLAERARVLKAVAEGDDWRRYLPVR
jgi:ligand-binding SRPBCC domain-containing protein